jgi:hypothetical protein
MGCSEFYNTVKRVALKKQVAMPVTFAVSIQIPVSPLLLRSTFLQKVLAGKNTPHT